MKCTALQCHAVGPSVESFHDYVGADFCVFNAQHALLQVLLSFGH